MFLYTNEWTVLHFYISMIYPSQKKWLLIVFIELFRKKKNILFAY